MSRRRFLKASVLIGAAAVSDAVTPAAVAAPRRGGSLAPPARQATSSARARRPVRIVMGGYGPPSTGFSQALKRVGDRLSAKFGDRVEVKYVYNILDLGYRGEDILWLV